MAFGLSSVLSDKLGTLSTSDHASVVSMNLFVTLLCGCVVIGHLLEENRWMNGSITTLLIGLCTGVVILLISGGKSSHLLAFSEDLFFIYLLPPIIFVSFGVSNSTGALTPGANATAIAQPKEFFMPYPCLHQGCRRLGVDANPLPTRLLSAPHAATAAFRWTRFGTVHTRFEGGARLYKEVFSSSSFHLNISTFHFSYHTPVYSLQTEFTVFLGDCESKL